MYGTVGLVDPCCREAMMRLPLLLASVAAAARDACNPIDDKRGTVAFRIHVAGVLAIRAVKIAIERAEAK